MSKGSEHVETSIKKLRFIKDPEHLRQLLPGQGIRKRLTREKYLLETIDLDMDIVEKYLNGLDVKDIASTFCITEFKVKYIIHKYIPPSTVSFRRVVNTDRDMIIAEMNRRKERAKTKVDKYDASQS